MTSRVSAAEVHIAETGQSASPVAAFVGLWQEK